MAYNNRQFMIFNVSELDTIDFDTVLETSADTVRRSVDGTLTFVKWESDVIPACVTALTTAQGPYTYSEIVSILAGPTWTSAEGL